MGLPGGQSQSSLTRLQPPRLWIGGAAFVQGSVQTPCGGSGLGGAKGRKRV